uniref:Uncharacterized protein n=1 Tax=Chromera velia CCMP2878 TaxID=1169474 RepID=A0A0G4IBQ5_9ALVE|eukprot:Cvel_12884.t1-p1 / transcript=Cvel_12884.t1 / gene=Cvel_12884 / organism=Chromera_velia_CCMP2878 / gene_product=hypothetical protein / transcript_product=hypothetical protein / location=Cvel_scaffold860:53717-54487(-) / protein_length=257 / sequence_SO=supercontig / SO=protein_coding / is_pseudo=false
MYASYTGLQKLLGAICVSSFGSDKALHKRANKLAQDPQHTLPQRQIAEELPEFQKRLKDWGAAFIAAFQGVQVELPPDLQKETAWDTFSHFPQLVEGKSFSEAELRGAFQEVQDDLKDRDLEAHDWVAGITFWPLLCEETKALARTKPKKQVGGQGKPVAVKYSWEYQKEVMAEASPTLDPCHTRYDWVPSVASGILRVISSSTGVDMEISTLHKSLLSAADTSDGKLADPTLQAMLPGGVSAFTNLDFESMSVETV